MKFRDFSEGISDLCCFQKFHLANICLKTTQFYCKSNRTTLHYYSVVALFAFFVNQKIFRGPLFYPWTRKPAVHLTNSLHILHVQVTLCFLYRNIK